MECINGLQTQSDMYACRVFVYIPEVVCIYAARTRTSDRETRETNTNPKGNEGNQGRKSQRAVIRRGNSQTAKFRVVPSQSKLVGEPWTSFSIEE